MILCIAGGPYRSGRIVESIDGGDACMPRHLMAKSMPFTCIVHRLPLIIWN
jgi:hypothetical protein